MQQTIDSFLDYLRIQDRSERTISSYQTDLYDFMGWFEETHGRPPAVVSVTPLDGREYRRHLAQSREMKPTTINRRLAALRTYFTWATENELVVSNPLRTLRTLPQPPRQPRWLTRQETYALLRAASEAVQLAAAKGLTASSQLARRNQAILALLLHAGLRVSEVCALRQNDIILNPRSGWVIVRFGKGRKYREVPLNNDARKALAGWLDAQTNPTYRLGSDWGDSESNPYLFQGSRGGPLRPRGVQRLIEKLAVTARLDGETVTPHTLRHTFGKNLVDAGVSLDRVALLLGHERLDTTAIYTTPSRADLAAAVEQVAWED